MKSISGSATTALLGAQKNESCFPELTFRQRMEGFLVCFVLGFVLDVVSFGGLFSFMTGRPDKFAITYSLGNIIALAGTTFLVGPAKQFKNMTDATRLVTSIVYVLALVGTIVTAVLAPKGSLFIILACVIVQFLALTWYCLSYIPYARTLVKKCFKSAVKSDSESG